MELTAVYQLSCASLLSLAELPESRCGSLPAGRSGRVERQVGPINELSYLSLYFKTQYGLGLGGVWFGLVWFGARAGKRRSDRRPVAARCDNVLNKCRKFRYVTRPSH